MHQQQHQTSPRQAPLILRALWLREMMRHPLRVASLAPSSPQLADRVAGALDLENAQVVLELGAGTGALTGAVLPRLHPRAQFVAIERSAPLMEIWRREYPGLTGVEGNVADLEAICASQGIQPGQVCCVVSGLPWASFPDWLQDQTMDAIVRMLRPGGQMTTMGYHVGLMLPAGKRFYGKLPARFRKVERLPWVWQNVPPAFVVRCTL